MGGEQSKQTKPDVQLQSSRTEDGVPVALLDLSKVGNFQEWLEFLCAIENTDEDRQRQLKRIHECTLACYLYLKSMGLQDDGSTTVKLIPEVTEAIQALEKSSMPELETLVTWQGLSVHWLIHEFFEHPYLQEVRKFGCEAWHFRKWGVIELIRQCRQCWYKELGSLSGPFVEHLGAVTSMWKRTTMCAVMESKCCGPHAGCPQHAGVFGLVPQSFQTMQSAVVSQSKGTPTTFISYTGAYTIDHLVEALGQLSPSEIIWLDILCVDQFAWTGKSRFDEMVKFKETFVQDLQDRIGKIRHTALILQKWDDIMVTLSKMWVLWEIFNTAQANAKLSVLLPLEQVKSFVKNCLLSGEEFDEIQKSLAAINAREAEASDDGDRSAIFEKMRAEGFDEVNKKVSEVIRQWQIELGEDTLKIQQEALQHVPSLGFLNHLGLLHNMQGNQKRAHFLLKEAVKICEGHLPSMNNLASVLDSQGQYREAEQLYRQTIKQSQQAFGELHPDTLTFKMNLARVLKSQGQYQEAEELYRQNIEQSQQVFGEQDPQTLTAMNNLASVLDSQGRYQEAEQLYRQTIDQSQQVLGDRHPDTLTSMNNLANVLGNQGQYQEAEQLYRQILKQRQQVVGEHHPDTLTSMNNLAGVFDSQGKYPEAEQLYRLAVEQSKQHLGEQHPQTLTSMNNLANVLDNQGQYQEAEQLFYQAYKQSQETLGEQHPQTLTCLSNLAGVHYSQGQYQQAEQLYRQTFEQRQQVLGELHPQTLTVTNNLAGVLLCQRKYHEAEQLYQQTFKQSQEVLGKQHPHTVTFMNNLAGVLKIQGKYEEVEQLY